MDSERSKEEESADKKSILFGAMLSLALAPIIFKLTRLIEVDHFKSNLLASILTLVFSGILIYIINDHLRQNCHQIGGRDKSRLKSSQRSIIFALLSSPASVFLSNSGKHNNQQGQQLDKEQSQNSSRKKIDPKYFKPKFIIHELMTFWGTTYTVITWGSFYVIGGTIVATEKLARKIKTKCSREQQSDFQNSSRGTGRSDSFMSYTSEDENTTSENQRDPLRRMSSWTKRSFSSIRKRFTKFVGSSMPHNPSMALLGGSADRRD